MAFTRRQKSGSAAVAAAAVAAAAVVLATAGGGGPAAAGPSYIGYLERAGQGEEAKEEREREAEREAEGAGGVESIVGGASEESAEIFNALSSVANARLAPRGSVPAGLLSAELGAFTALPSTASTWDEVTDVSYDADDPNYRDPSFSNSSGGAGFVAGRITGLAVGDGYLFAAGANGGVFRKALGADRASSTDDGPWVPISDRILSLSTGDLVYDAAHDTLWYATGEANTGATSYAGAGVYRLANATTSTFAQTDRVGGTELESRGINQLKVSEDWVYAATTRGLWRYPSTGSAPSWSRVLMPNPDDDSDITKPYNNIVNDVAIQPGTEHVLANAAWRSGAAYNGFYYSDDGADGSFTKVNPTGALSYSDVGNAEFAYSADGSKLYVVVESPNKLNHSPQTVLDGVYVSPSGTLRGPWNRIATSGKLAASGSALGDSNGVNYRPGVQAWYNNFIEVDPTDADHVYLGLEEVYETTDGGNHWSTPGPYWNFGLDCWAISDDENTCPETTHSDQHSIAIDDGYVYVGNDGGVKSRPVDPAESEEDSLDHASDWLNHSQGLRTLQYYGIGIGNDPNGKGVLVAGGLQDNGGSLLRAGDSKMVSPFGGDGGDIIVDAKNGCQILDEYVYLELWMTTNCGQTDGSESAVFDVGVPDPNPRFTAPFRIVRGSANTVDGKTERWVAGGNKVWTHDEAFGYTEEEAEADPSHGWTKVGDLGTGGRMTVGLDAIADPAHPADKSRDVVYAAWCGESNCNSAGFTSGVATSYGGTWRELAMKDADTTLPNRYPNAVWIDEKQDAKGSVIYLAYNGYNRRFIEGPGAGVKHVFKGVVSTTANSDGALTVNWTDISGNMPDVPATDIERVGNVLVVGTDYGVLVSGLDGGTWKRVGASPGTTGSALPLTSVYDLHVGPDGFLYAGTHGRGIWRTSISGLVS